MTTTPASLLERLRRPLDVDAWNRFVDIYSPVIYTWARRMGLQEADAGDLVQDVFAILVQTMPAFRHDRQHSFRGWLKTITLNKYRERGRRKREEPLADPEALEAGDQAAFWDTEFQRHVVARAVTIMRADFEPATWQACWQVVVDGRPAAAVAAEFGITVGAVYAARFRVLARLRHELAGLVE